MRRLTSEKSSVEIKMINAQYEHAEWTRTSKVGALCTMAGTLGMYFAGKIIGMGIDHVPYLNEVAPFIINSISDLDTLGNTDGLSGIIGGIVGFLGSGELRNKRTYKNITWRVYPIMPKYEISKQKPRQRIDCEIPFPPNQMTRK